MKGKLQTKAILLAGPTASGKSGLALRLAQEIGGTIINADSMQVYQELRILTARPSQEDEAAAPHRLYGLVPGSEAYSAGRYANDATAAMAAARASGSVPIIVGGTGLYFKVLLEGLSPIPAVDPAIRQHWRGEVERLGTAALYEILAVRDREMASRLSPSDPQRIVRALEVLDATGQSLAVWQRRPGQAVLDAAECLCLVVSPAREELYERCNARLELMMQQGALAEVEALMHQNLSPDLPVMRALGVRPLMEHLRGNASFAVALERTRSETRHYAKRQMTWLRRNMIAWKWLVLQETERFDIKLFPLIDP